ncbi:unnamed protein product [Paramecium sonneborni]|uniref:Uncharacterized protein n=1 Tax=Paramecium sonneborni TaxID=65129 RepID=A0A8S1NAS8_9CILI|nr:unnamed protein product [Paramecium sonneborni]
MLMMYPYSYKMQYFICHRIANIQFNIVRNDQVTLIQIIQIREKKILSLIYYQQCLGKGTD